MGMVVSLLEITKDPKLVDLEQDKQYFLSNSPIQEWELKDNQVIHLSW